MQTTIMSLLPFLRPLFDEPITAHDLCRCHCLLTVPMGCLQEISQPFDHVKHHVTLLLEEYPDVIKEIGGEEIGSEIIRFR